MSEQTYNKILVLATQRIGDCLLATCIPHTLRKAYPASQIDVLVTNQGGKLAFLNNPDINNIITVVAKPKRDEYIDFIKKYWRKYDLVVNDTSSDRSAIYALIAGKKRLGVVDTRHASAWLKKLIYSRYITESENKEHRLVRNLRILSSLNIKNQPAVIAQVNNSDNIFEKYHLPPSYIVLHTPSSMDFKQWPEKHWVTLIEKLLDNNSTIVLTGGHDAREQAIVNTIVKNTLSGNERDKRVINLAGKIDFGALSLLLKNAALFIGPDCGPAHLASSFNIPIISIFGPIPASMWAPWPYKREISQNSFANRIAIQTIDNVSVLQSTMRCVPCYAKECNIKQNKYSVCLEEISPEQVFNAIKAASNTMNLK